MNQDDLKQQLSYDQDTGIFYWIGSPKRKLVRNGDVAGCPSVRQGYIRIQLNGKSYLAHRLAWLYVHGHLPKNQIDHINGIKSDNRIENLREADNRTNHWNSPKRSTNKSGFKGVHWHKQTGTWQASCRTVGKQHDIGRFEKLEDAVEAVRKFREQHHGEFANHG